MQKPSRVHWSAYMGCAVIPRLETEPAQGAQQLAGATAAAPALPPARSVPSLLLGDHTSAREANWGRTRPGWWPGVQHLAAGGALWEEGSLLLGGSLSHHAQPSPVPASTLLVKGWGSHCASHERAKTRSSRI